MKRRRNFKPKALPDHIAKTPRSAATRLYVFPRQKSYPIGDLYHARSALVFALSPNNATKRKKVVQAVAKAYPTYNWAAWWNSKRKGKTGVPTWSALVGAKSNPRRRKNGEFDAYVRSNYPDFIDLYIRSSSAPELFLDKWAFHCEDTGISCTADQLDALIDKAVEEGEVEDGEIFVSDWWDIAPARNNPTYWDRSTEDLGRPMGAKGEAYDIVGNLGYRYGLGNRKYKNVYLYLYDLDDYDRAAYAHIPLKKGEKLYRFRTDRTYRAEPRSAILVKINVDRDLLYFMTEESADRDDPVFQTRGINHYNSSILYETTRNDGALL